MYARIHGTITWHRKTLAVDDASLGVLMRLLGHCAEHLTDGEVPEPIALAVSSRSPHALEALTRVGWLERTTDGYRVVNYGSHNVTRDEIEGARAAAKERKAKSREKHMSRVTDGVVTASVTRESQRPSRVTGRVTSASVTQQEVEVEEEVEVDEEQERGRGEEEGARVAHATASTQRSRGDGPTCGTDPSQPVAAAPAPAQWALRPSAQQEPAPKAEAPAKGRQRRPAQPVVDSVPPEGTAARRVYEAITTDAALAPIVRGPGDLSMRLVAICDGTSADPVAEVIAAGAWHARNLKWSDGASGLLRWVKTSADRARAMPAVVGTPRASSEPARIDYQGKRVVGAAGLPSGDVWASDRDEESEAFARIRERTQPKGRGE